MSKKCYLIMKIITIFIVVIILIFNLITYLKSPIQTDIYSKYVEIINNNLLDESFDTNIFKNFMEDFKNYKNFYKKCFILITVFDLIILILNVISFLYLYYIIKKRLKIIKIYFYSLYIYVCFWFLSIVFISKEIDSHHFMNRLALDMMESEDSNKFIDTSKKCKTLENICYYFSYIYIFILFILIIFYGYIFRNEVNEDSIVSEQFNELDNLSNEILCQRRIEKCLRENYNNNFNYLNNICSICLNNFIQDEDILILPCNHVFHFNCMKRYFLNHNNCPVDNLIIIN